MTAIQESSSAPETKTRAWNTVGEMDDEWTPDNIEDLSEGTILTLAPREPYIKTMQGKDKAGVEWTAEKSYVFLEIERRVMPTRVNKYSRQELADAYGTDVRSWHGKRVVAVVDRSGKWPFITLKPKAQKNAKKGKR